MNQKTFGISKPVRKTARRLVAVIMSSALVSGAAALFLAVPATAKPEFSAQTKLPCGQCHVNPAGGGKLKAFGEKFHANGNKLK